MPAKQRLSIVLRSTRVTWPTWPRSIGWPCVVGNLSRSPQRTLVRAEVERRGTAAELLDAVGDSFVGFVGQHALDDFERGVVGIAAALDKARREAGGVHGPVDGGAAAMDDDGPHADGLHEHDVDQQVPQGFGSSSTLPPSLMTVTLSRNWRIQPRASIRTSAFWVGVRYTVWGDEIPQSPSKPGRNPPFYGSWRGCQRTGRRRPAGQS